MTSIFSIILLITTLLLALAKNMGKKITISIATFNMAVYLCGFIGALIKGSLENPVYIIMTATWFAIAGLTLIMTIAKYIDKASRNTK